MSHTNADFDQADALLDSVRLHVAGDVMAAGILAIPAIKRDPIQACAFLTSLLATAIRAYAHANGSHDPVGAVDELWRKPSRDGVS